MKIYTALHRVRKGADWSPMADIIINENVEIMIRGGHSLTAPLRATLEEHGQIDDLGVFTFPWKISILHGPHDFIVVHQWKVPVPAAPAETKKQKPS